MFLLKRLDGAEKFAPRPSTSELEDLHALISLLREKSSEFFPQEKFLSPNPHEYRRIQNHQGNSKEFAGNLSKRPYDP